MKWFIRCFLLTLIGQSYVGWASDSETTSLLFSSAVTTTYGTYGESEEAPSGASFLTLMHVQYAEWKENLENHSRPELNKEDISYVKTLVEILSRAIASLAPIVVDSDTFISFDSDQISAVQELNLNLKKLLGMARAIVALNT